MPVLSWAHSHYWAGPVSSDPPAPEIGGSGAGGYVPFQASVLRGNVVVGSGLGSLQAIYEWLLARRKG